MNRSRPLAGALAIALALPASSAHAGPFDLFGAGGRDSARAGASAAHPTGPSAVFYNVGALTSVSDAVRVGASLSLYNTSILLKGRPDGYDVPDLGADSPAQPSRLDRTRRDTDDVAPIASVVIAGASSLGVAGLKAGFTLYLPTQQVFAIDTHFVDERERLSSNRLHFELIDARLRRLDAHAGVAYALTDWLSVGAGGVILPGALLDNDIALSDPTNQEDAEVNLGVDTIASTGYTLGAHVTPRDWVRVGLSYRSALAMRVEGVNRITVIGAQDDSGEPLEQRFSLVPSYTPASATLGVALGDARRGAEIDLRWTRWSEFVDTQGDPAGFEDTVSTRAATWWPLRDGIQGQLGLGYDPTPVPPQTGRTNYVDNDRVVASLGATHDTDWLGGARVDWFLQLHALLPRDTDKAQLDAYPDCAPGVADLCDEVPDTTSDPRTGQPYPGARGLQTGNPGFPGFSSGGWIGTVGVSISLEDLP